MKDPNVEKNSLCVFISRMKKLGIKLELGFNYPWVYLTKINGKVVKEKRMSEHGYTIVLGFDFLKEINISELFSLIRKYI